MTLSAGRNPIVLIPWYLLICVLELVGGGWHTTTVCRKGRMRCPKTTCALTTASIIKLIPLVIVDNLLWGKDLGCLKQVTPKY